MGKLESLCVNNGITLVPYSKLIAEGIKDISESVNGVAMHIGDTNFISYNDKLDKHSADQVIAHELGHVVLGHLTFREDVLKIPSYEVEANIFSAVLMALQVWEGAKVL